MSATQTPKAGCRVTPGLRIKATPFEWVSFELALRHLRTAGITGELGRRALLIQR
jgi:hypothetical protein